MSTRSTGIVSGDINSITSNILGDQANGPENVTEIYSDRIHTFLDTVYAVTWLNESLPPFTTETYAVAPFDVTGQEASTPNGMFTASTMLYETDVSCVPANITLAPNPEDDFPGNSHYNITNSQGFNLGLGGEPEGNGYAGPDPAGTYTGYCNVTGDPIYGISTSTTGDFQSDEYCGSPNISFTFLALWQNDQKLTTDETKGLLGAFCKPAYYSQLADVTVFQNNQSIQNIIRRGTRTALDFTAFNISLFENMIANTGTNNSTNIDTSALISSPSLGYTPAGTVPLVIGIGIGLTSITQVQMPALGNLEAVVNSAHKLMFAAAAQAQMAHNTETIQTQVTRQDVVQGVVLVRAFAIVIEVLLAVIGAISISILVLSARRPNKMLSDPHSLASLIVLSSSPESETLLAGISAHEMATESELKQPYGGKQFILSRANSQTSFACISSSPNLLEAKAVIKQPNSRNSREARLPREVKPARPKALSIPFGAIFILVLVVLIIALSMLKALNDRYNGFTPPTKNAAVQQIIFNYLPTAIGTFIEPAWVYLNRLFAILMPWEELRRGRARFDASIGANYVSLPPQLLFVRALRSRHFLLSSICVMALLANVLAVAFSGLFKQANVREQVSVAMQQQYQPVLQDVGFYGANNFDYAPGFGEGYGDQNDHWDYDDPFLVVDANMTRNVSLPAWTTSDYWFLPFNATNTPTGSDGTRTAITQGFGVDVPCFTQDQESSFVSNVNFTSSLMGGQHGDLTTNHTLMSNGTSFHCYSRYTLDDDSGGDGLRFAVEEDPGYLPYTMPLNQSIETQLYAIETVIGMDVGLYMSGSGADEAASCASELALTWLRGTGTKNASADYYEQQVSIDVQDSMLLLCYPQLNVAIFSVTVDATGQVLSYYQVNTFASNTNFYTGPAVRPITETNAMLHGDVSNVPTWHTTPAASDWLNYFIALEANSTDLTDPTKPLPDPSTVTPLIERSYRRIFATALGLNQNSILLPSIPDSANTIPGTVPIIITKWILVPSMFVISITILSLYLFVAIEIYIYRPRAYLPRIPTSILSQMAYFGSSSVVHEMRGFREGNEEASVLELEKEMKGKGWGYAYGKYVGVDHRPHVGIERGDFCVLLEGQMRVRRRWGQGSAIARR